MSTFTGSPSESQRLQHESILYKMLAKLISTNIRVALPGIIESFDPAKQTVSVNLAVRDKVRIDGQSNDVQIPTLLDVPIVIPRAGGTALTLPITVGDECLVILSDMCINSWWQNGGIQNQEVVRRHDLSDGFAILGPWSQPRVIETYSTSSAQLRTDDGTVSVSVGTSGLELSSPSLTVNGVPTSPHVGTFSPSASLPITVNGVMYYLGLSATP